LRGKGFGFPLDQGEISHADPVAAVWKKSTHMHKVLTADAFKAF